MAEKIRYQVVCSNTEEAEILFRGCSSIKDSVTLIPKRFSFIVLARIAVPPIVSLSEYSRCSTLRIGIDNRGDCVDTSQTEAAKADRVDYS